MCMQECARMCAYVFSTGGHLPCMNMGRDYVWYIHEQSWGTQLGREVHYG